MPVPLTASTQVLHEPNRFYDLNIPLAKCKNNLTAQRILRTYGTYALKANKGLVNTLQNSKVVFCMSTVVGGRF